MFGNILQPDECWMLDGRLPTVSLRMNRQSKNAQRIAEHLVTNRKSGASITHAVRDAEQIRIRAAQCDYPGGIFFPSTPPAGATRPSLFCGISSFTRNAVFARRSGIGWPASRTNTHSGRRKELEQAHIGEG